MKKDIHKGGRPPLNRPDQFYLTILDEYQTMTTTQIARVHNVSRATISAWLKKARAIKEGDPNGC